MYAKLLLVEIVNLLNKNVNRQNCKIRSNQQAKTNISTSFSVLNEVEHASLRQDKVHKALIHFERMSKNL